MTRPSARPHLANAAELDRWADLQLAARSELPHLIRRLIRHENDQVQRIDMRSGHSVGLPGYDGIVEATRGTSFVPAGLSVWEMGVGPNPSQKANADYIKRSAAPLGIDMAVATFVFVTPRYWPKKKDWEAEKRAEGKWGDVRALDADDIEQALDEAPSVHVWVSELLDMTAVGVQTMEGWWERFAAVFEPALTPHVVLAGREDEAAALLRLLARDVGRSFVRAPSVDDGLAFVVCAMLAANDEAMLSRSLLVHDGVSLRRLDATSSLLILVPYEEELRREALQVRNHHLVFIVTDGGNADIDLPPLNHQALEAALREAGVPESDLSRYTRAANKSLVALQRVSSPHGQPEPAEWAKDLEVRAIRRAWLARSWNSRRSGDVEVLEALTGNRHEELEERLRTITRRPDPLFTNVGPTWAVASGVDSWPTARVAITEADLAALEFAVQAVFSAVDPRLELPAEERWQAAIHGKVPVHSSDMRGGLSRTVALLGARGDEVRLGGGRTARLWVEAVAAQLFARANGDRSGQLWASLEDVMPRLAEAAPDVFLTAVSEGTQGSEPVLQRLFQDEQNGLNVSSPHTGLLWALETVAWSPSFLGLATELLARLAELDPGGRLSNRPDSSLVDVFRPWLPQTSATAATRLSTLDGLLARHPEVGWRLLLALLPEHAGFGMETHKPEYREWVTEHASKVTKGEYVAFVEEVGARLLALARATPHRWSSVVHEFDRLPPETRNAAVADLGRLPPEALTDDSRASLWSTIEALIRRHRQYAEQDWALSEDVLAPLAVLGEGLRPRDPSEVHRWLFEDWHPDIGVSALDDLAPYDDELLRARAAAVREIVDAEGLSALLALAERVELPWALGAALGGVSDVYGDQVVPLLESDSSALVDFARAFVRARAARDPSTIEAWVERFPGRPTVQARLLLASEDLPAAWLLADSLGEAVRTAYWSEFLPYGRGSEFPEVSEAARRLLAHGRAAMAIDALSMYSERHRDSIDVDLVIEALHQFGTRPDPESLRVSEHDLTRLLTFLRERGVDETDIAAFEWKFLPILRQDGRTPSLERLLARSPKAFTELISLVFRAASARGEPPDSEKATEVTSNAYRLLHEWSVVPGTNDEGGVDFAELDRWISEARRLLADADRSEIGELQIGEVLAHAPEDADGTFPTRAVRDVLEAAPDDRLGRGFTIGLFNTRGMTFRGMAEGGKQEFDLANRYDAWATAIEATHPRTASTLRSVAEFYRQEGLRNDEEAKRFLEGLDR
jgi:hypothetical protein